MSWVKGIMIASAIVFVVILGHGLRTGVLMAYQGPDIHRSARPKTFWSMVVVYVVLLAVTVFAAIRW